MILQSLQKLFKNAINALLGDSSPFREKSASIAKERLKIIVSHQRIKSENKTDFLPDLQRELIDVISKYIEVDKDQVKVGLERRRDGSVLELNAILTEKSA